MVFLPLSLREGGAKLALLRLCGRMGLDLSDLGWVGNNINKM